MGRGTVGCGTFRMVPFVDSLSCFLTSQGTPVQQFFVILLSLWKTSRPLSSTMPNLVSWVRSRTGSGPFLFGVQRERGGPAHTCKQSAMKGSNSQWLIDFFSRRRPYKRIQQRPFFHFVLHTTTTTIYYLLHNTHNTLITTMHTHFLKVMFVLVLLLSLHVHHLCSAQQQQQQQRRQEPFNVNTFVQVLTMGLAIVAPTFLFLTSQQQQHLNTNENVSTSVETQIGGFANTTTTKLSCCPLSEEYNCTTFLKPPFQSQQLLDGLNETQSTISHLATNHSSSSMMLRPTSDSHWAQGAVQRAFPSSLSIVHSTDNRTLFLYIMYTSGGSSCLRPRLDIYGIVFFHGTPSLAGPSGHLPEYTNQQLATFDGHSHLLHAMFPSRLALPSPVSTHPHPPPQSISMLMVFLFLHKKPQEVCTEDERPVPSFNSSSPLSFPEGLAPACNLTRSSQQQQQQSVQVQISEIKRQIAFQLCLLAIIWFLIVLFMALLVRQLAYLAKNFYRDSFLSQISLGRVRIFLYTLVYIALGQLKLFFFILRLLFTGRLLCRNNNNNNVVPQQQQQGLLRLLNILVDFLIGQSRIRLWFWFLATRYNFSKRRERAYQAKHEYYKRRHWTPDGTENFFWTPFTIPPPLCIVLLRLASESWPG